MAIYFVPIILCAISAFSRELSENRRWILFAGILLCLFFCFGYMTGSDWRNYEKMYEDIDFNRFYFGYKNEPGYYLLMWIAKRAGLPFWVFFILVKCILFRIIYQTVFDYCKESGWITLMYFLPWFGLYFFIDNPMRNCIAVTIFILSTKYVLERKFWKFLLLTLLAMSFHVTAVFVILLYPIVCRNISKWIYLILFIVLNVLFAKPDLLINIIVAAFSKVPYLDYKVVTYFLMDSVFVQGKFLSFGLLWQTVLFILMLLYRDRIISQIGGEKGLFAYNCAMVYFLLVRLSMTIPMFVRLQMYLSVYVAVCIGLTVLSFEFRSRCFYMILLAAVASYTCYDKVTKSARYVPYTNVLQYVIKGDYPSYSKRFFYNIKNSPYTDEIDVESLDIPVVKKK